MALNKTINKAKSAKRDEFYTQRSDIENELCHYKDHFRGKIVYCNCDDPKVSNFFDFFSCDFQELGLKQLIATCYKSREPDMFSRHDSDTAICLNYWGTVNEDNLPSANEISHYNLIGDGDFRSWECIELLKMADIVVTNLPFSLFREYVAQLIAYDKKFLIIGPWNAVTYKEIFPLVKENRFWLGYGFAAGNAYFSVPSDMREYAAGVFDKKTGLVKFRNVTWFTNLDHHKRHEELILYKNYNSDDYPTYDNYDAINVDRVADIPVDYDGMMGVPITFLDKYNPDQFEILGITDRANRYGLKTKIYTQADAPNFNDLNGTAGVIKTIDGYKRTYRRLLIRRLSDER